MEASSVRQMNCLLDGKGPKGAESATRSKRRRDRWKAKALHKRPAFGPKPATIARQIEARRLKMGAARDPRSGVVDLREASAAVRSPPPCGTEGARVRYCDP